MGDLPVKTPEKSNNIIEKPSIPVEIKNYKRGETVELDKGFIIENLPEDFVHVKVKRNVRRSNLVGFATKSLKNEANRNLLLTGMGFSTQLVDYCADILSKKFKDCCQIVRVQPKRIEEIWEPLNPDLSQLKVVRNIPYTEILVSKDSLDPSIPGYKEPFSKVGNSISRDYNRRPRRNFQQSSKRAAQNNEHAEDEAQTNTDSLPPEERKEPRRFNTPRKPRQPFRNNSEDAGSTFPENSPQDPSHSQESETKDGKEARNFSHGPRGRRFSYFSRSFRPRPESKQNAEGVKDTPPSS